MREDERFVNWMRTAALPRFRKLWGRIDALSGGRTALEPGDVVVVTVVNRWNTYSFDGKKSIVLVGWGAGGGLGGWAEGCRAAGAGGLSACVCAWRCLGQGRRGGCGGGCLRLAA